MITVGACIGFLTFLAMVVLGTVLFARQVREEQAARVEEARLRAEFYRLGRVRP